jgi:hypothetical protein
VTPTEKKLRRVAGEGGSVTLHKHPCQRCGHSPDDHRLDDSLNIGPVDPRAKFRCVDCSCPDFVGEALTI